jgi:hypothetical protein
MQTTPSISNIYTPSPTGVGGGILGSTEVQKEEDKPAIMVNLLIELALEDANNQKDIEREFLKRLLAFSKSDAKMSIKLVKQPRDYHDYEVIKIS